LFLQILVTFISVIILLAFHAAFGRNNSMIIRLSDDDDV